MAITICDLCAKRKICIDKNKFYPVVKCQNYHEGEAIKVEQTNEEWFDGLSTEEKAKWLSRHSQFMYECGQKQVAPKIMYEEDWEWWLKQPHTEKE